MATNEPYSEFLIPETGPLYGVYRGIVVGLDDPEQRGRYQVHVYGVDHWFPSMGTEVLLTRDKLTGLRDGGMTIPPSSSFTANPNADPRATFANYSWAELICHAPKGNGEVPYYSIGDPVWVVFEGGNRFLRIIIGAWLSWSMGVDDMPFDAQASYPESRVKSVKYDWAANGIEESALGDQHWVRLSSGFARFDVCRLDNSVRVDLADVGTFGVEAGAISMRAGEQGVFIAGTDVFIQADGDGDSPSPGSAGGPAVGLSQAMLGMYSNWKSNWYAKDEMFAGQYLDYNKSLTTGRRTWHQTRLMTITPKRLILGYTCPFTKLLYNSLNPLDNAAANNTLSIDMEANDYVCVRAGAASVNPDNPLTGFIGLYSFANMEVWGGTRVWIGAFQSGTGSSAKFCQTPLTIIQSQYVQVGICSDSVGPLNPYVAGSPATCRVELAANDLIRLHTCGAGNHPAAGGCPSDPGLTYLPVVGDIVIQAANDLVLMAGGHIRIGSAKFPAPIYAVQCVVEESCMLFQYSTAPCTPVWNTFATICFDTTTVVTDVTCADNVLTVTTEEITVIESYAGT